MKLLAIFLSLSMIILINSCATTGNQSNVDTADIRTGTPSPLSTSSNPWNNVNPQVQGQYQMTRGAARR